MLSLSANVVTLSHTPSPSVSSQIDDAVAALALAAAARWGSRRVIDTHSRPALVPVHAIGLPPSFFSVANSFTSKSTGVTIVLHRLSPTGSGFCIFVIGSRLRAPLLAGG